MLEAIKRRDEEPLVAPPALPRRPKSKGRLPSLRRMRSAVMGGAGDPSTCRSDSEAFQCCNSDFVIDNRALVLPSCKRVDIQLPSTESAFDRFDGENNESMGVTPGLAIRSPGNAKVEHVDSIQSDSLQVDLSSEQHSEFAGNPHPLEQNAELLRTNRLHQRARPVMEIVRGFETISQVGNLVMVHKSAEEDPLNRTTRKAAAEKGSSMPMIHNIPVETNSIAIEGEEARQINEEGRESIPIEQISDEISWSSSVNVDDADCHDSSCRSHYEQIGARLEERLLENETSLFRFHPLKKATLRWTSAKRWIDTVPGLKKDSCVWYMHSDNNWVLGIIQSTIDAESVVVSRDGKLLRMPLIKLLPANPDILEGVDDLLQLSYLNAPAILHNLQYRYAQGKIFTQAGPVMIAVNPFKKVPLSTDDFVEAYNRKRKNSLSPHVCLTAEFAFDSMMKDGVNQSIIISGESGAGKTETSKMAMKYLSSLGGGGVFENEILQANLLLEAFGNAKTLRNDNASRFGKLIDMYFQESGIVCGAKIQTYLLEKSRVVYQIQGGRSYNIFYQLCAGADPDLRERLHLRVAEEYQYLNHSGCMTICNIDDASQFHETLTAMDTVRLSKHDQESAFTMLAAILWLGNIKFTVFDNENHVTVHDDEGVDYAARLLRCKKEYLMRVLSTHKICPGNENRVQNLTHPQAVHLRDALAMAIYTSLFDWLVDHINKALESDNCCSRRSISIVDIYGFESFEKNTFEQLCINYANERLQQFFNRHLIKLEQEEYSYEGIEWTKIVFEDNQKCLDLIEKRPVGLLSLLDEECASPEGTDSTFADKLKESLVGHSHFKGGKSQTFSVCHYAGEVVYDTAGFLEKNRDMLHSDLLQLLASCEAELPQLFAVSIHQNSQKLVSPLQNNGIGSQTQSVVSKFKGQLLKLMQKLENTVPHFILCIRPNAFQVPWMYDHDLVLQQLCCSGVFEVVRISRSGYPTRLSHQLFANRYEFLLPQSCASQQDVVSVCVALFQQFNISPDMYQVGYTKLFFRAGQIGRLEDIRMQTIRGIACIQKLYRGYKARCYLKCLKRATIFCQSLARASKVRRYYRVLRQQHQAAIVLQKLVKNRAVRREYLQSHRMVILLQSVVRGWLARKKISTIKSQLQENQEKRQAFIEGKEAKMDNETETTIRVQPSMLAELQGRVLAAEAALCEKENANALLQQRLSEYDTKWSEYEAKMTSMEEIWQKQIASLQQSLATARKSLTGDGLVSQTAREDNSFNLRTHVSRHCVSRNMLQHIDDDFDWDDNTSVGTKASDPNLTPSKPPLHLAGIPLTRGELDGRQSVVSHLVDEFEHQTQVFKDDADFLVEVKSGQTQANLNPEEELQKLKQRYNGWKRDFKVRLRETRGILQKLGSTNSSEKKKKWWGKR